ncbi:hypothetical protein ACCAA_590008 [Candidatus Accumulibacter aalborgensis]|uniref:Uncharacterized protein n=1 Tax=Candidatus Accumulibacter aalborgensis TaxID=1860102 RepID=A0A1A8XU45_9PROT|nr:hypothetical protein ACCAA_590008 [Candidatus Accumulibacter aalborgensis]
MVFDEEQAHGRKAQMGFRIIVLCAAFRDAPMSWWERGRGETVALADHAEIPLNCEPDSVTVPVSPLKKFPRRTNEHRHPTVDDDCHRTGRGRCRNPSQSSAALECDQRGDVAGAAHGLQLGRRDA